MIRGGPPISGRKVRGWTNGLIGIPFWCCFDNFKCRFFGLAAGCILTVFRTLQFELESFHHGSPFGSG